MCQLQDVSYFTECFYGQLIQFLSALYSHLYQNIFNRSDFRLDSPERKMTPKIVIKMYTKWYLASIHQRVSIQWQMLWAMLLTDWITILRAFELQGTSFQVKIFCILGGDIPLGIEYFCIVGGILCHLIRTDVTFALNSSPLQEQSLQTSLIIVDQSQKSFLNIFQCRKVCYIYIYPHKMAVI